MKKEVRKRYRISPLKRQREQRSRSSSQNSLLPLMWPGFDSGLDAVCGLNLSVLCFALNDFFHLVLLVFFPLKDKPILDHIRDDLLSLQ